MPKSVTCPSCGAVIDTETGKAIVPVEDRVDELEGRLEQIQLTLEETRRELESERAKQGGAGEDPEDPDLTADDPEGRGFGED